VSAEIRSAPVDRSPSCPDAGAGSVLVVAVAAVALVLCGLLVPLYMCIAAKRAVEATADAAALAAADGLSGAVPGFPCDLAEVVARAGTAELEACRTTGDTASVTVGAAVLGIRFTAGARAGPPP
jgi:secretion/DNA translocation related TadE-like protein